MGGDARLHVDDSDSVSDHVVELSRDVQTLFRDTAAGLGLSGAFGAFSSLERDRERFASAAYGVAGRDGERRPGQPSEQFGTEEVAVSEDDDARDERGEPGSPQDVGPAAI